MNRIIFRCWPAILMVGAIAVRGAEAQKAAAVEGITEYRLDNGLRVLLFPDASQSKVTINMTVLVGSRQEGYGETGMAHLLEHMVFKGTPKHPHIPAELQEHGASFNGSTSSDRVNYYETMAATEANLEFGIALEADRLVNSTIKKEDLASEMTVVRNEFERGENSPGSVLRERVQEAAYDWHNYGKPTIGNRSDIERVPVENLRAFYRKYYQPDNIVLVVAGGFEEARALALVEKYFGVIPRPQRKLDDTYTEEPPQDGERSVTLRRVGDLPEIIVAYHIPAAGQEDSAALAVLANILSSQPSGRLYKALVETKKATSASASARAEHDPGLMMVSAEVPAEGSLEDVRNILLSTVEGIGTGGVTEEEVKRAKQQMLRARERAATDTAALGVSLSEWIAQGDWRLYFLSRDWLEKVTPEAVAAVAKRYLQRNNRTVGEFIPTASAERVAIPEAPDLNGLVADYKGRAAMAAGEAFDATPANIEARVQRLNLAPGVKVTLLPKKTRGNEVRLNVTLRYGNEDSLAGYESATGFLSELMLRGTRKLDYQQLRDELDRLDATLTAGGGGGGRRGGGAPATGVSDSVTFSIQAKRDTLPAALEILRQVLREPALPPEQFELLKRRGLAGLEQTRTEPAALAPRELQRTLNPFNTNDIRYIPTIEESIERLRAVTYEQVARLYSNYLGAQAGEVTVVGDFDRAACEPILAETFRGWVPAERFARITMPFTGLLPGTEHVIDTPDKANATYMGGMEFMLRDDDPDYPAMLLGNYILGGGTLSSRLGNRIRQRDGLSYGVTSGLAVGSLDRRATLTITAICNPRNMGKVKQDVDEELTRLTRDGVTAEELAKAKEGYLEALKVGRASDAALAGMLSNERYLGRTMMFQEALEKKIRTLTPQEVDAAWRQYIDPKRLTIVTAGDFATKTAGSGN